MTRGSKIVRQALEEYGDRVRGVLSPYLEPGEHLLDTLVADYPRRGGKMMRPSLLIATARAFGAPIERTLHIAAALEMQHNAMLIHDDIEDESEQRRGAPTLHAMAGVPLGICAGNALALRSLRPMLESLGLRPYLSLRIFEEMERMALETAEGQALELGWIRDNVIDLKEEDYLLLALKKTCWFSFIYPCRVGALIAGCGKHELDRFIRFGFFLGLAFQIQDDVLNLDQANELYGKELNGDLREGKRTLLLIRFWAQASDKERARLNAVLALPRCRRREADIVWMRDRIDAYGCLDYARQVAQGFVGAALHELEDICAPLRPSKDRRFIEELVLWVSTRVR